MVSRGCANIPSVSDDRDPDTRLAQVDAHARPGTVVCQAGGIATSVATLEVSCLIRSASCRLQISVASCVWTTIRSLTPAGA